MNRKNLNDINLRLEVITSCEKIGISQTSLLFNISRDTIHRWKKNYEKSGMEGLTNKSRKGQRHPRKIPPAERNRIIQTFRENPKMPVAAIIRKLKLPYTAPTVAKVLKSNPALSPARINSGEIPPFHFFYLNIERIAYEDEIRPDFMICARDLATGIIFTGFSNENTPFSCGIFADYLLTKIKKHVTPKKITLLTCQGNYDSGKGDDESFFEHTVKKKFGAKIINSTKKVKRDNLLESILQNHKLRTREELLLSFYTNLTESNLEKGKNLKTSLKSTLFLPPLYTDSHFHRVKELADNYSYWHGRNNRGDKEEVLEKLFRHLISSLESKMLKNKDLTTLENFSELLTFLELADLQNKKLKGELLFKFSQALEMVGDWKKAEEVIFKIIKSSRYKQEIAEDKIKAYEFVGSINEKNGSFATAAKYYKKALRRIRPSSANAAERIQLNSKIGSSCKNCSQFKKAFYYFHKMLKISEEAEFQEYIIRSRKEIAGIYYTKGNYPQAVKALEEIIAAGLPEGDRRLFTEIYWDLAKNYANVKNYRCAEQTLTELLKLLDDQDRQKEYYRALGMLGIIKTYLNKRDEARKYFCEYTTFSEDFAKKTKDKLQKIFTLYEIATIKKIEKDYAAAVNYANKAILLARRIENKKDITFGYLLLGNTYQNMGQYKKALKHMLKVLELNKEMKDFKNESFTIRNIALIYRKMKDHRNYQLWLDKLKIHHHDSRIQVEVPV